MLSRMRKTYDAAFKAKVAFEAAKGEKTTAQIARDFGVHPNQVRQWQNHLMEQLPELFSSRRPQRERDREELEAELYQQIGQLKMELEWLKKESQTLLSGPRGNLLEAEPVGRGARSQSLSVSFEGHYSGSAGPGPGQ